MLGGLKSIYLRMTCLKSSSVGVGYTRPTPATYRFVKEWQEQVDLARVCLHKAAKRSKKWADRKRRDTQFQERDLVLVKLHLVLRPKGIHKGLGTV